jgi:hypothetical protein
MDPIWQAFTREAELAAEHLCIGTTALGRADFSQPAYYYQAFFALSVGFERGAKLALVLDRAIDHDGALPPTGTLKGYGHDLVRLLGQVDAIARARRLPSPADRLPQDPIHQAIVDCLSGFAANVTRYYNLDLIVADDHLAIDDPIATWDKMVRKPAFTAHISARRQQRIEQQSEFWERLLSGTARVRFTAETGELIDSVGDAAHRAGTIDAAIPWVRMYVLQLARFLGAAVVELGDRVRQRGVVAVPFLQEVYAVLLRDDAAFRSTKTWSIYPRRPAR